MVESDTKEADGMKRSRFNEEQIITTLNAKATESNDVDWISR